MLKDAFRRQQLELKNLKAAYAQETADLKRHCKHAENKVHDLESLLAATSEESGRLHTELQKHRMASISAIHEPCWQYEVGGVWHVVSPQANEQMLHAYLVYLQEPTDANRFVTLNSGGVARKVDFELMKQENCDTRKTRNIKILAGVPQNWSTSPERLLRQSDHLPEFYVKVSECNDWNLHGKVLEILRSSVHGNVIPQCSCMGRAKIISIHRIEHRRLWQRYKVRCAALRQEHTSYNVHVRPAPIADAPDHCLTENQNVFDCGETLAPDIDEKILLHGTGWDNANNIVQNGFDNRVCRRGLYGDGVYFASAACKSHQYTCDRDGHKQGCQCKQQRTFILARVALGDSYHTKQTLPASRRPPIRNSSSGDTFDSIVVNPGLIQGHHNPEQLHQEFVVFERDQAYPCFVVQYQL